MNSEESQPDSGTWINGVYVSVTGIMRPGVNYLPGCCAMAESTGGTGCVLLATEIMGMNEMSACQVYFYNVLYCLNPLWTQSQYQHLLVVV